MAGKKEVDASQFGASFMQFMDQMASTAPEKPTEVQLKIEAHFGEAPSRYAVVREEFAMHDHANLHQALQRYLEVDGRSHELFGVSSGMASFQRLSLAQLIAPTKGMRGGQDVTVGPVAYVNVDLGDEGVLACVASGVYLVRDGERPLLMYVRGPGEMSWRERLELEVMAAKREHAEAALAELRTSMRERNLYRGRIISLEAQNQGEIRVRFHRLPAIARDDIILPSGVLDRVERHAIRFSDQAARLRKAGRHLKRGLLLHGPPGTGKTLTAMHLAGRMPNRTVLLLTGRDQALVAASCRMARLLEPATVILEDVDLIAEERTRAGSTGCHTLLFELLNQMDGLSEDADVLFLLTTNRPEILEPALAARPGRVDLAIEVPLPDADCRRRLIALYGRGLELKLSDLDRMIDKTNGASAAFMRELLRTAALCASDASADTTIVVRDEHLDAAIHELTGAGGALTASLLGAELVPTTRA